jgi:hypothetical protein
LIRLFGDLTLREEVVDDLDGAGMEKHPVWDG